MSAPIAPGSFSRRQRQRIGDHDADRARASCSAAIASREVAQVPVGAGILEDRAEHRSRRPGRRRIADDHLDPQRLGPGLASRRCSAGGSSRRRRSALAFDFATRCAIVIASAAAVASSSSEALATVKPGQVADHRLVVQQRLQPALADLGLVGRVGGVPGRVLQDVALDRRRRDRAVVALPDQRGEAPGSSSRPAACATAARARTAARRSPAAPPGGSPAGTVSSISASSAVDAHRLEHLGHLGRRGADMAAVGEIVGIVVGGGEGHRTSCATGAVRRHDPPAPRKSRPPAAPADYKAHSMKSL